MVNTQRQWADMWKLKNISNSKMLFCTATIAYMLVLIAVKDLGILSPIARHSAWGQVYSWNIMIGMDRYLRSIHLYLLNLVSMVPAGLLIYNSLNTVLCKIAVIVIFSFAAEFMQPIMDVGMFDVISVIHMTVGGLSGMLAAALLHNRIKIT